MFKVKHYKMLFGVFFILFPGLISARISIYINATIQKDLASGKFLGSAVDILSNRERRTFKLSDGELKQAVQVLSGDLPTNCWVRSPTPEGNLHQQHGWKQVQRTLTPHDATIATIHAHPVIVDFQECSNNGTESAKYDAGFEQTLQYTVSSKWMKSGEISVSEDNFYKINFKHTKADNQSSMLYTAEAGEDFLNSAFVKVGFNSEVELVPGQSVISALSGCRGTLQVELDYIATLDGDVACVFENPEGHQYLNFDVNQVMEAGGIPKAIYLREILTIDYYADAWNSLTDVNTNVEFGRKNIELPVGKLEVIYDESNVFIGDVRIKN